MDPTKGKVRHLHVVYKGLYDIRGARPDNTAALVEIDPKNVLLTEYKILNATVDQCIQAGRVDDAAEALKIYKRNLAAGIGIKNPLNVFQKDLQNGGAPYIGAHCVEGAFREACKFYFPGKILYEGKGIFKNTALPGQEHVRKTLTILPKHIFLHQPDMSNGKVLKPNRIVGQQPSKTVGGFARYEEIDAPWMIEFDMSISTRNRFRGSLLEDKAVIEEIMVGVGNLGFGGCRGAGFGRAGLEELTIK
jgi:hypothetical protein